MSLLPLFDCTRPVPDAQGLVPVYWDPVWCRLFAIKYDGGGQARYSPFCLPLPPGAKGMLWNYKDTYEYRYPDP